MEEQALGGVGRDLVDPLGELALGHVDRGVDVGLVPLVLLADVDQLGAGLDLVAGALDAQRPRLLRSSAVAIPKTPNPYPESRLLLQKV